MNQYYIYLSSDYCKDIFRSNSVSDFTNKLDPPIELNNIEDWSVALTEISYPPGTKQSFSLYTDVITTSYGMGNQLPILRNVNVDSQKSNIIFDRPYYIKINNNFLEQLRVYIRGLNGESLSFNTGTLSCVLHLRRSTPWYES